MKYYIIAGEASGDLHGSNLIRQLKTLDNNAEIRCWGGDKMQAAGATLVKHYKELAFMGFAEVVINLRTILANLAFCKKDITQFNPDVLVLIDYPGFNLRIAKWAKNKWFKTAFYISPQVWAWKESRVKSMKQSIDKMLVILPFEKDYYRRRWHWNVVYTGHPLLKVVADFKASQPRRFTYQKPVIALLPGSRKQEISVKLPIMLQATKAFPDYQFVIAQAPGQEDNFYKNFTTGYNNVALLKNETYRLLSFATAAIVTSGTATLETALFGVPEIVCYKGSNISYLIAKRLIKIKYISLVNLIMDKEVIKELIQNELTVHNLIIQLNDLLHSEKRKVQLRADYISLNEKLQTGEDASHVAAKEIIELVHRQ